VAAFGEPVEAVYDLTRADVIVTLGGDVLGAGPGQIRYAHDFAERRRRGREQGAMPRLYSIESTPSLTGTRADRRVPLPPADLERFAQAVGAHLGLLQADGVEAHPAAGEIAESLRRAGSRPSSWQVPSSHGPCRRWPMPPTGRLEQPAGRFATSPR
jgi:hypothetical protein